MADQGTRMTNAEPKFVRKLSSDKSLLYWPHCLRGIVCICRCIMSSSAQQQQPGLPINRWGPPCLSGVVCTSLWMNSVDIRLIASKSAFDFSHSRRENSLFTYRTRLEMRAVHQIGNLVAGSVLYRTQVQPYFTDYKCSTHNVKFPTVYATATEALNALWAAWRLED
jgi:hypothetical protein